MTCDGPSCHFTMPKELGACYPGQLQTYFPYPCDSTPRVDVLLDVCHMLKLVRNTFGTGEILIDDNGNKIMWQYLVELEKLQEKEGLRHTMASAKNESKSCCPSIKFKCC